MRTRQDRGARALRGFQGCMQAGLPNEDVSEYTVYDAHTYKVIANVQVRGKHAKDPTFTARLDGPKDMMTQVVCRKERPPCMPVSSLNSVVPKQSRPRDSLAHVDSVRDSLQDFQCWDMGGSRNSRIDGGERDGGRKEPDGQNDTRGRLVLDRSNRSLGSYGGIGRSTSLGCLRSFGAPAVCCRGQF